jgi:hypothetical protein
VSWDALPSDAEIAQVLPLLSRIQALKGGKGGALLGIQLMVFFVQHRVQPLQHWLTKLWTFSGLEDPAHVSEDLIDKKDVDKRVRGLTKLTKEHAVADLTAEYFDSVHPLPEVCICLLVVEFHVSQTVFSFSLVALLTCSCARAPIPPFVPSSSKSRAPSG